MKRLLKGLLILVFGVMSWISSVPALGETASVRYEGGAEQFVFLPGSSASASDLFLNFKKVMPGDRLSQRIGISNQQELPIRLFLRADPHDETVNPLSPAVAETESVESMEDFLRQLQLTVWQGDTALFQASPDQTAGLTENVFLGEFSGGEATELTLDLTVPMELGNEYADRIGEADWVFLAEEVRPDDADAVPVTIQAAKLLDGNRPSGSEFTFVLTDQSGEVLQEQQNRDGIIVFDTLIFREPGTHTFLLSERKGSDPDVIYDETVYAIEVQIAENDGLEASLTYRTPEGETDGLVFRNRTRASEPIGEDDPVDEDPIDEEPGPPVPEDGPPKTGDETNILLWIVLLVTGIDAMIAVVASERRSKKSN